MRFAKLTDAQQNGVLIAIAEGASIRLKGSGVVTGAWGTTERRQLALSSAELHHGAARAKGLRAPAEVVGRAVCLGKPRGVPAGAQIFHRKGPCERNGPNADGIRNRCGEQGECRAMKVCRPNHRVSRRVTLLLWGRWAAKAVSSCTLSFSESVAAVPRGVAEIGQSS